MTSLEKLREYMLLDSTYKIINPNLKDIGIPKDRALGLLMTIIEIDEPLLAKTLLDTGEVSLIEPTQDYVEQDPALPNIESSAFHLALKRGSLEMIKLFLEYHPPLNNCTDCMGNTPLANVVERGSIEIIAALLDAGADINHSGQINNPFLPATRLTAFHVAVLKPKIPVLDYLIARGADINALKTQTSKDFSMGSPKVYSLFQSANNTNTETALDMVRRLKKCKSSFLKEKFADIENFLIGHGAKTSKELQYPNHKHCNIF